MSEPIGIGEVLIVVALGFGIALIVLLVMKSQLTSVKPAKSARAYVDRDRMELTERTDRFLYRTVHSTPKAKSNSSGGGRSGGRSGSF